MNWMHTISVALVLHLQKQGLPVVIDQETLLDAEKGEFEIKARPVENGVRLELVAPAIVAQDSTSRVEPSASAHEPPNQQIAQPLPYLVKMLASKKSPSPTATDSHECHQLSRP